MGNIMYWGELSAVISVNVSKNYLGIRNG